MEIHKLNDLQIKSAEKGKKEYRLSDGGDLYLVVKPSGGKLWRWSYEFNGKEKLLSYGPFPAVTLAQARELHKDAEALKRQGTDPAAAKQAKKHEEEESKQESSKPTFAALTAEWLKTWSKKKSARYVGTVKTRLDRDILPVVGNIPIHQLKAPRTWRRSSQKPVLCWLTLSQQRRSADTLQIFGATGNPGPRVIKRPCSRRSPSGSAFTWPIARPR
jgi:hypothetical protein